MATRLRSTAYGTIFRGQVDPGEIAFAVLGAGQPLRFVTWATAEAPNNPYTVKVCPDGEAPDGVAIAAIGIASPAAIAYALPGCPVLLGGTVAKGDLLTVSGGKWVKATAGKVAILAAASAGSANDLIMSALIPVTV